MRGERAQNPWRMSAQNLLDLASTRIDTDVSVNNGIV